MQVSAFGYTPAAYTPSMPSEFARYGRPDTTWSGGIGSLNAGRIPLTGGKRKATRRSVKHSRKNSRKSRKHARRPTHRRRTARKH
jgi:hypothetical protein